MDCRENDLRFSCLLTIYLVLGFLLEIDQCCLDQKEIQILGKQENLRKIEC